MLVTGGAVLISFICALFVAVFVVEFAPEWMRRILEPVIRLLASVPSVIYGLLGVLVLVPFIGNHVITEDARSSVAYIVSLNGYSLLAGVLILSLMIAPIMIAVFADGLRSVPRGWLEGSLGARRQPLAHVLEDRRADRAPGADRRNRAGDRSRPRRGGHARDGLRRRRLRAEPARRADLLRRAVAAVRRDDPADVGGADARRR